MDVTPKLKQTFILCAAPPWILRGAMPQIVGAIGVPLMDSSATFGVNFPCKFRKLTFAIAPPLVVGGVALCGRTLHRPPCRHDITDCLPCERAPGPITMLQELGSGLWFRKLVQDYGSGSWFMTMVQDDNCGCES